jgi:hypothetical protein
MEDGNGSESCPMTVFQFTGAKPVDFTSRLIQFLLSDIVFGGREIIKGMK